MSAGYAGAIRAGRLRPPDSRPTGFRLGLLGASTLGASALTFSGNPFAPLPGTPTRALGRAGRSALAHAYGRLPLAFERNQGQFDREREHTAHGGARSRRQG